MIVRKILARVGLDPYSFPRVMKEYAPTIFLAHEDAQRSIVEKVSNSTMIGKLGILSNIDAVDYISNNELNGCIVECGVWKGGSVAAMLLRLLENKDSNRSVYLFDTFAGMTEPTSEDNDGKKSPLEKFKLKQKEKHNEWCYSPLDEVKKNIDATKYNSNNIHYIKGDVIKTLENRELPEIALLRLDTDWYKSTKVELEHLYPKVVEGGVIIIDDYGAWSGARQAVDEYLQENSIKPLMHRIDCTRRMFIKQTNM